MNDRRRTPPAGIGTGTAGVLIAALVGLVACSDSEAPEGPTGQRSISTGTASATPDDAATSTAPASAIAETESSTATSTPDAAAVTEQATVNVDTHDVPSGLTGLAQGLYAGDEISMTRSVADALGQRNLEELTAEVAVSGSSGEWKGTPLAVLTAGDDVTLAVKGERGWQVVGGWWPSLGVDQPVLGGTRHVLLLGSDARPGEPVEGMRADTLQVVGVDGRGGGGVLGIARDSWVTMPSGRKNKINAAMVEGGPSAQQSTVAAVTGLPIEGYALTGFESFTGLVDALGGVSINAPRSVLDIPSGPSRLDGATALRYARERKTVPGGDFGRSAHQGVVLVGIAAMVRAGGPESLPGLLSTASPYVRSNLSAAQVLTLAANVYVVSPGKVGATVAKGGFGWSKDGQSIVLLDKAAYDAFADFKDGNLQ